MALSLIILDCDGIILESLDIKSRAFARLGSEYGQKSVDLLCMYNARYGGVSRYEKFAWWYQEIFGRAITEREKEVLNEKFVRYALDEILACALVPGIREVLDTWHKRVPIYVASGAPHQELNTVMDVRGLTHYFEGIYGSPPGKANILRSILEKTGISPSETIMVGDSNTDQMAAEAVQCHFYGRGAYFAPTGHPWSEDLFPLNEHLEALAAAP